MNHSELLKDYHDSEDKLCLAQVLDKMEFVQKRGQIEATSFLSMPQISMVEAFLRRNHFANYTFLVATQRQKGKCFSFIQLTTHQIW